MQCIAQPQEAWIARYNGGFSNKTNMPLAMALDNAGNVYVAGSSQNAGGDNDYVVLKYAPNGTQLFAARYDSTNGANDTVKGFALDKNGNALVTGSGGTVKFDANGAVAWTAPYAGNDVAVDTNKNVYVTGFSANDFATVKLTANGSNVWVRTYDKIGEKDESQKVAVDNAGNVYVAGWETWQEYYVGGSPDPYFNAQPAKLKYDSDGNAIWTNAPNGGVLWGETIALIPDNRGNVYQADNDIGPDSYHALKYDVDGHGIWSYVYGSPHVAALTLDPDGNAYLTGDIYLTTKLYSTNGSVAWQKYDSYPTRANGMALDESKNVYVTGVWNNDFATIKYDNDGNQLWVKRYNGPANGNDGAMAIAVALDGSIYVTGYSANTSGGSDITTIKYGFTDRILKQTNGNMLLQFSGTPGLSYGFQGTTNFEFWDELGSSEADTNGIIEFLDTNAPLFSHRFYRWHYP